jgi:Fe-S oxidoreductase
MQRKNYDLAAKIAEPLRQTLESTAPTYVLTECSACKMQIEHLSDCTVLHPIKILAQTYSPA